MTTTVGLYSELCVCVCGGGTMWVEGKIHALPKETTLAGNEPVQQ